MMKYCVVLICVFISYSWPPGTEQTDWSGGPAGDEPWGTFGICFQEEENTGWISMGILTLGYPACNQILFDGFTDSRLTATGDVTGDGLPDVIVADNGAGGTLSCLYSPGASGAWFKEDVTSGQEYYRGIDTGDMDGNGTTDIVMGFSYSTFRELGWLENPGWAYHHICDIQLLTGVCCGDHDQDGDVDVLCSSPTDSSIFIMVNPGASGSWTRETVTCDNTGTRNAVFADINQDGAADILAALPATDQAAWFENGAGWQMHPICSIDYPKDVASGDFDGNGTMDVIVCGSGTVPAILCSNQDGSGLPWTEHPLSQADEPASCCALLDMNSDGDMECAIAQSPDSSAMLLTNSGGDPSSWSVLDLRAGIPQDFDVIDFDQNGDMELVSLSRTSVRLLHAIPGTYANSGELVSVTAWIPCGTDATEWGLITWESDEPPGTDISFQLRSATWPGPMGEWSSPVTQSGTHIGDFMGPNDNLIQYRAILSTDFPDTTPVLYQVEIEGWVPGETEDSGTGSTGNHLFRLLSNPSSAPLAVVRPSQDQAVSLRIYDLSGRMVFQRVFGELYEECCQIITGLPSGSYTLLVEAGELRQAARLCILR